MAILGYTRALGCATVYETSGLNIINGKLPALSCAVPIYLGSPVALWDPLSSWRFYIPLHPLHPLISPQNAWLFHLILHILQWIRCS